RADLRDAVDLVAQGDAGVVVRALRDAEGRRGHRVLHLGRVVLATDQALGGVDRVLRVRDGLALGDVADEALPRLGDRDHGRGRLVATAVGDDDRGAPFDDRYAGVERPELDA